MRLVSERKRPQEFSQQEHVFGELVNLHLVYVLFLEHALGYPPTVVMNCDFIGALFFCHVSDIGPMTADEIPSCNPINLIFSKEEVESLDIICLPPA